MAIGETTGSASRGGTGTETGTRTDRGGQTGSNGNGGPGLTDRAKHEAQTAGERISASARQRAETEFTRRQGDIVNQIEGVGEALRDAADRLEEHGQGFPARYIQQAADRIDDFAQSVRERGLEDLVTETETFARRQPELFIGGAVLLGVGIGRFLRASSERRRAGRTGGMAKAAGGGERQSGRGTASDGGYGSSGYAGLRGTPYNPTDGDDDVGAGYGGATASGGLDERTRRMRTTSSRADEFAHYPAADALAGRNAPDPLGAGAGGQGASAGGSGAGGLGDTGSGRAGTPGGSGTGMGAGRAGQAGGLGAGTTGAGTAGGTSSTAKDGTQKAGQSGGTSGTGGTKP